MNPYVSLPKDEGYYNGFVFYRIINHSSFSRKTKITCLSFSFLILILATSTTILAQSYLGLDGGLEGGATIDNITLYSTGQVNKWSKANAAQSIFNETSIVRSGVNSLKIGNSSATGRRLFSPAFTSAIGSNLVIQYYRRSTDAVNTQGSQTMISIDGVVNAEVGSGIYTNVPAANTWEKVTYAPSTLTSATALWAGLMHRQSGSGGDLFIDDMAIYVSNVVDNIAPNSSGLFGISNATTNSLDLNWSAAAGGIDNGGYLLVRYSSNPAAADDPNVNGIYAIGNAIPGTVTGTVVYQGPATSFTNTALTPATQYWYKLYTYDKAYNYSSEIMANGTTTAPFPFVNGDYRPSLNGTNFSVDGAWEIYSGGSWITGQIAPQNITSAARPNRIIIDRPGIGGASSGSNTYKDIIVTNGGELLLSDNVNPIVEFISSGNTVEVQRGGILILSGQVHINSSANIIIRGGAYFTLNNTIIGNTHGFWGGIENFEKGSQFTILNHSSSVAGSSSLMNTVAQITDNASGGKFGNLTINFTPSSNWVLIDGNINVVLCDTLDISNGSATAAMMMFSNINTPSASIRGDLIHHSGIFALSGSSSGTPVSQTLNVGGSIISIGGILKLYHNGGTGSPANININLKGDLTVSGVAFSADVNNSTRLNFTNTNLQKISIAPNCSLINLVAKSGSSVQLKNQNLNFNGSCLFTVETNAVFDFGFNGSTALKINQSGGSGNAFNSLSGAYLKITSPSGLNVNAGELGNLENLPGSGRNINTTSTFHYIGKAPLQLTGNALTTSSNGKVVIVELDALTTLLTLTNGTGITSATTIDPGGGKLEIRQGTLISSSVNPITSDGRLVMLGGLYQISELSIVPQLTGAYTLTAGSTIELNGAGNQQLRGARDYKNLTFSNTGTKTLTSAPTSVTGTITIANSSVLDVGAHSMGGLGTDLTMTGTSRYISGGTGTKPDASGTYSLSPGTTIEFSNNSSSTENTRLSPSYYNIVVSGSSVANSSLTSTPLLFQSGGSFTVTSTGLFKHANVNGFNGAINTSISNTNNPTINLQDGSTIDYYRNDGANQHISNSVNIGQGATGNYYHLIISGTGNKTAPVGTLEIKGNFTGAGTSSFVHNNGRVFMNGSTGQAFSATSPMTFYNFINGSLLAGGGLTVNSNFSVAKEFKVTSLSGINLNTGDITLKSDAVSTANVAIVPAEANIIMYGNGRFNIERYFPADRSWRLVTSPLSANGTTGSIFSQWQNNGIYTPGIGAFVTGPGAPANGLDYSNLNNYSLKAYQGNSFTDIGNTLTTNLSGTNLSAANIGYFIFVRGDRSRTPIDNTVYPNTNITTLSSRGKLQTGTQLFDATNASIPTPAFSLVGNPYASSVDFNLVTKINVNPNRFYIWDPHINQVGAYVVMEDNITAGTFLPQTPYTSSPQGNYIQSSQAFFVERASPGPASIVFDETNKSSNYTPLLFRPVTGKNTTRIRSILLVVQGDKSTILADGNLAEFSTDYTNDVDIRDAFKFTNIHENLGLRRDGKILSIERRGDIISDDTLFYNLTKTTLRNYRLQFICENMNPLLSSMLEDAFTGTKTPISLTDTTFYNFTVNGTAGTYAPDRFRIIFKVFSGGPLPVNFVGVTANREVKDIAVSWVVQNELGIAGYKVEKSTDGINFIIVNTFPATSASSYTGYTWLDRDVDAGVAFYRIRSVDIAGRIRYSKIVKVNSSRAPASLMVYPNPICGGKFKLRFSNMPAGKYRLSLFNTVGQLLFSTIVTYPGTTYIEYNIILPKFLTKGIYKLEIIHPDKSTTILKVIE